MCPANFIFIFNSNAMLNCKFCKESDKFHHTSFPGVGTHIAIYVPLVNFNLNNFNFSLF